MPTPHIGVDLDRFFHDLDKFKLTTQDIYNALDAGNKVIEGQAKINHQPHVDTGFLWETIQAKDPVVTGQSGTAEVHAAAEYAAYHEYGTSRSKAYPFMTPAVYGNERNIIAPMDAVLREAINRK